MDVRKETLQTIEWIRDYCKSAGKDAAVIGISGGKDSSVAAALLKEALGKENVIGVMMPNGMQNDIGDSIKLIGLLGIRHMTVNIGGAYDALINITGELSAQSLINIPPRLRMTVLYAVAQTNNALVCGTSNASERYVGYGTKWGDTAADFNPLGGFLTDEVVAIGEYLGLLPELTRKIPADGLTGKTDEQALGFSYRELNGYIRTGTTENKEVCRAIERMHNNSAHKLAPVPIYERDK